MFTSAENLPDVMSRLTLSFAYARAKKKKKKHISDLVHKSQQSVNVCSVNATTIKASETFSRNKDTEYLNFFCHAFCIKMI